MRYWYRYQIHLRLERFRAFARVFDIRPVGVLSALASTGLAVFFINAIRAYLEHGFPDHFDWNGAVWVLRTFDGDGSFFYALLPYLPTSLIDKVSLVLLSSVALLIGAMARHFDRHFSELHKRWLEKDKGIKGLLYVRYLWGDHFTDMCAHNRLSDASRSIEEARFLSPFLAHIRYNGEAWFWIIVDVYWKSFTRSAPSTELVDILHRKSWRALFDGEFEQAANLSFACWRMKRGTPVASENYAHALLFQGRVNEAMDAYRQGFGFTSDSWDHEATILDDFRIFRAIGMHHPLMLELEREIVRRRTTASGVPIVRPTSKRQRDLSPYPSDYPRSLSP